MLDILPDTSPPQPVRLADYRPPAFLIDTVDLAFELGAEDTRVKSRLGIRRNPAAAEPGAALHLDGEALELVSLALDGEPLGANRYQLQPEGGLTLADVPDAFTLDVETRIAPQSNTALSGLYTSGGNFCTQCEPEGFRRITYFIDRPDVMARYTTTITADRQRCPVLLANGNPVARGDGYARRHWAKWVDPHPKPSYLFALVAGDLVAVEDRFTTRSGKEVALAIWVRRGDEDKCGHAMASLKKAMRWDEDVFGLEYDLDVFNIVAVSDFNMGAMENKGLNIFNTRYVLAKPETATDTDYQNIESVIAHEYFHNWTGNRVTCRDWFQLSLKEGLTVFRDQEFSADQGSRAVKRIGDVRTLRAMQFPEDDGPLAHPVRPDSYLRIDNFYTPTVYNKGAELVRMIHTLLGREGFRRGMDLYFERCDGRAVTVEDFLACFAEVTGRDLAGFKRWYDQAGTPVVSVAQRHDDKACMTTLTFAQATPPTPGQADKVPVEIPIAIGLLSQDGKELPLHSDHPDFRADGVFALRGTSAEISFRDIAGKPVASLLRCFSAPVRLDFPQSVEDLLLLAGHDPDRFNRWQAIQSFAGKMLLGGIAATAPGSAPAFDPRFFGALERLLTHETDYAFAAEALAIPSEQDLAREIGVNVDPDAILSVRNALQRSVGQALEEKLLATYRGLAAQGPYSPDAKSAARRNLRNMALNLLVIGNPERHADLALAQLETTDNMNDRLAALGALTRAPEAIRDEPLAAFERAYGADALLLDKWFALQARVAEPGTLDKVKRLVKTLGMVNCPADYKDHPKVINGFSELMADVFGKENGIGARSAVGMGSLPNNMAVEIECIFEV